MKKVVCAVDPVYFVKWPRQVAMRLVAAYAKHDRKTRWTTPQGAAEPLPRAELASALTTAVVRNSRPEVMSDGEYGLKAMMFILEAVHGTDAVLEAAVDAWTALAKVEASEKNSRNYAADGALVALGALLHRASPSLAKTARARLAQLINSKTRSSFVFRDLELLLDGKKSATKQKLKHIFPVAWLFQDDAAFALKGVQSVGGDVFVDVRGAWLGGEDAIDAYAKFVPKMKRVEVAFTVESFGMLKAPRVVPMMQALAARPGGEGAAQWLETRGRELTKKGAKLAAPKLAKKATPASAEKAFDALTNWLVKELEKVRGKKDKETEVLSQAAKRYMEIRSSVDEPATDYLGHFFMVDGVGLEKDRVPAWERLAPSDAESARWGKALDAAMR